MCGCVCPRVRLLYLLYPFDNGSVSQMMKHSASSTANHPGINPPPPPPHTHAHPCRYERGKVLIFVNSQDRCDTLFRDLLRAGYPCLSLHGGKDQSDRESTISDFKSNVCNVLVATSGEREGGREGAGG